MDRHPSPIGRPTVLYVEDQPVNVLVMRALFDQLPELQLVVATTGREAIGIATGLRPALMILDLNLPDCHGSQLLQVLQLLPGCDGVTAVAATADCEFDIADTGFEALWAKPLNLPFVKRRIRELAGGGVDAPQAPLPSRHAPGATRSAWR